MWLFYALLAMVCATGATFAIKQLLLWQIDPLWVMMIMLLLSLLLYSGHLAITQTEITLNRSMIPFFLLAAFGFYAGNLYGAKSLQVAPNPGYTVAILSLQIVLVTIVSVFWFDSTISLSKVVGILFMLIGGLLLAL